MRIFVRAENLFGVDFQDDYVSEFKDKICHSHGIQPEMCILSYNGRPLIADRKIDSYDIKENSTLDLSVKLLGGKVHGSLARAGKVKGQTPKVEKQEKKKAKTGRAKRRMQYNRRFVNVVAGGRMKKKGPNSNS